MRGILASTSCENELELSLAPQHASMLREAMGAVPQVRLVEETEEALVARLKAMEPAPQVVRYPGAVPLAVHEMAKRMDRASFEGAVASYPTTAGGTHRVRIGRYFMWSIVKLFAAPRAVERISLRRFSETCTLYKSGFSQAVMCRLSMAVRVVHRGKARDIAFALRKQVGAHFEPGACPS